MMRLLRHKARIRSYLFATSFGFFKIVELVY